MVIYEFNLFYHAISAKNRSNLAEGILLSSDVRLQIIFTSEMLWQQETIAQLSAMMPSINIVAGSSPPRLFFQLIFGFMAKI